MLKKFIFLGAILLFIGESSCQRFIHPTYRPPPQKPVIIRTVREAANDEPLWLYEDKNIDRAPATGDHPYLPSYIDDVKMDPNRRYARSANDEPLWLYGDKNIDRAPATGDHPYLPSYIDDVKMDPNRRYARSANDEPLWLYGDKNIDRAPATGDHPYLPSNIDDVKMDPNRRYARSANDEPLWLYGDKNIDRAPATGDHPYLPSYIDDVKMDPNRRYARSAEDEPLWLYKDDNIDRAPATGDHPFLPSYIDDVNMDPYRRYARSLDSPSAKRGGGSHTTSGGSRDTGATHPGHNRRNARDIRLPFNFQDDVIVPRPRFPIDTFPKPQRPGPIYARVARDVKLPGLKRPTIIIPGWNPNARIQPYQRIKF